MAGPVYRVENRGGGSFALLYGIYRTNCIQEVYQSWSSLFKVHCFERIFLWNEMSGKSWFKVTLPEIMLMKYD